MDSRVEVLCAELRAIEYWEWLYQQRSPPSKADEISHKLRQARRTEIMIALQVLYYRFALWTWAAHSPV